MRKIETIWHEILFEAVIDKKFKHTQKELACKYGFSLSTVNHALDLPSKIGAVRKESKFFVLADLTKLLYFWASLRNLSKDVIYKTYYEAPVLEIEGLLPAKSTIAGYTAARYILKEAPADYSSVYFYFDKDDLKTVISRFPKDNKHEPNIYVLDKNPVMDKFGNITTLPQTFVDIWNMKDWYSKDFTGVLEEKINGLLS